MSLFLPIFLASLLVFSGTGGINSAELTEQRPFDFDPSCPLNFDGIQDIQKRGCCFFNGFLSVSSECHYLLQSFLLLRSDYLRTTGRFVVPPNSSQACWKSFQSLLTTSSIGNFDVRSNCLVSTSWVSNDCAKVSTRADFEALVPEPELQKVRILCNRSLGESSVCDPCLSILSNIQGAYFNGSQAEAGGLADCAWYANMYAAAFVNQFGPFDYETIKCLFSLDLPRYSTSTAKHERVIRWIVVGCVVGFLGAVAAVIWFIWVKLLQHWRMMRKRSAKRVSISGSRLELLGGCTGLVKYTLEEMKEATDNFSRRNLIGNGGFGNVFRGMLPNGSEVALKRFKNCSASSDINFAHEVEVIASVKHMNLVGLRGYCMETDAIGSHQRIIVCDLVQNGSLHDYLFGSRSTSKLAWPIRRKIALGTARGLAYLHSGARTRIIHRDVKASNILLDESFEPKLADFGLAKFTPDGFSHFSTKVAGTLGYLAPEYALYGQLTEKSDVYSFGIVLLQLLSGKEAVLSVENGEAALLVDWAWELVRKGEALDVIDDHMAGLEKAEVMEKYVLVGVLSAHPLLQARPTMEQIVKILESVSAAVPSIPDPSISDQVDITDFKRSKTCNDLSFIHLFSSIFKEKKEQNSF